MKIRCLCAIASTILLAACGGGSDGEKTAQEANSVSYSGFETPAKLTTENSYEFLNKVLLLNNTDALAKSTASSAPAQNISISPAQTMLSKVAAGIKVTDPYQARSVSETDTCSNGGTARTIGNINDSSSTGTLNIVLQNCNNGSGVLNGNLEMIVTRSNPNHQQPEVYELNFDDLSFRVGSTTISLSGNQSYNYTEGVATTISNILETSSDDKQLLIENFTVIDNTLEYLYLDASELRGETGNNISGRIFISDYGYVDVYTNKFVSLVNTQVLPYSGNLVLKGDSSSLSAKADFSHIQVQLDENGNGVSELVSILKAENLNPNNPPVFNQIQPPTISLVSHSAWDEPLVGFPIDFDAFFSSDPDGGTLDFEWTLTTKPVGSLAEIMPEEDFPSIAILLPDVAGDYTITLVVTNKNGLASTKTSTVTVVNAEL